MVCFYPNIWTRVKKFGHKIISSVRDTLSREYQGVVTVASLVALPWEGRRQPGVRHFDEQVRATGG